MATNPQMQEQSSYAGADPAAQEDQTAEFSVTITCKADGTYTVSMSESDQSEGGEQDEPATADNIDDALSTAKEMIQAENGEPQDEPQEGGNEALSPEDAKSAWKQMAAAKKAKQYA